MVSVNRLGYVGWGVTDLAAWGDLLKTVYGLHYQDNGQSDQRHYRVDDRARRLTLYQRDQDRVEYIGWEVDTREELEKIADKLEHYGVAVKNGTKEQIEARMVLDLISFEDPDGFPLEVFLAAASDAEPFKPSVGRTGFVTGHLGLGHAVINCKDIDDSAKFYSEALGFKLSDYIHWPDNTGSTAKAIFMHCNPRHHSVALVNESFGCKAGDFNHLMLEAESLDDVGRAYDIAQQQNFPIALTLGYHTNDQMTSFYLHTPSGWLIEYGWGGLLIDDDAWDVKYYTTPKVWGHNSTSAAKT